MIRENEARVEDVPPETAPEGMAWLNFTRAEKVPELVARQILRGIVDGGLKPGDVLPAESVMLERFGVGRASLREARRILEIHGLIRIKPGPRGGPVVDAVTGRDYGRTMSIYLYRAGATFRELAQARLVMEPVMAKLAAQSQDPEMATRVKDALAVNHQVLEGTPDEWAVASENFHEVIAGMSGNRVLDLFSESLVSIHRARVGSILPPEERESSLRAHDRLADAILTGKGDAAEQIARRHLADLAEAMDVIVPHLTDEPIDWR